jgi:DNA-binding NarL/FixJ family response regulator
MKINVGIVEDDRELRESLAKVVEGHSRLHCVAACKSGEEALQLLPTVSPDVVLMDINLPGMNGVECVRRLKQLLPATQVVMLTAYEDTDNIFGSLEAGASGYLLKRSKSAEILEAIKEVLEGGSPMTAHIARKVVHSFQNRGASPDPMANLAEREREVLDLLAQGLMYKEIADKLGIGFETVRTYVRRIYEKLQVRSRTEAVAKALRR